MPEELRRIAFINGLSGLAMSASGFGLLSVLTGTSGLHGVTGAGLYLGSYALCALTGFVAVTRVGAHYGIDYRTVLFLVFATYFLGFVLAVLAHPVFLSLSCGLSVGAFWSALMLLSLNKMDDGDRDRYATVIGLIQQGIALAAPVTGAASLALSTRAGLHDPFAPAFLIFAACTLLALPVIRRFPHHKLHNEVRLPLKKLLHRRFLPCGGIVVCVIACETLLTPLLLVASLAFFGRAVDVGWMSAFVAVVAAGSLLATRRLRLPGTRWKVITACFALMGGGFVLCGALPGFPALVAASLILAVLRPSCSAAWYAFYLRLAESRLAGFGRNQALVAGEFFIFLARGLVALVLIACGIKGLPLDTILAVLCGCFFLMLLGVALLGARLEKEVPAAAA